MGIISTTDVSKKIPRKHLLKKTRKHQILASNLLFAEEQMTLLHSYSQ